MSRPHRIVLAASLSLFPTALCAQTCLGGASFADRRAQIGADASVSGGARSSNGGVSIGSPSGLFASVGFGTAHDRDGDNAARLFAAAAGIGLPRRTRPDTQICPFLSAVALSERDFDVATDERRSSHAFGLGAGVGTILGFTPLWLEIVPFASAALITQTTTIQHPPPLNTSAG